MIDSFQLVLDSVIVSDAGDYQCMFGDIVDSQMESSTSEVSLSVARQASLQFGEEVGTGDSWVLLKDQVGWQRY